MSRAHALLVASFLALSMLFGLVLRWANEAASAEQGQAAPYVDVGDPVDEPSDVLIDLEDDDVLLPAVTRSPSPPSGSTTATADFSETHLARDSTGRLFRPPRSMAS